MFVQLLLFQSKICLKAQVYFSGHGCVHSLHGYPRSTQILCLYEQCTLTVHTVRETEYAVIHCSSNGSVHGFSSCADSSAKSSILLRHSCTSASVLSKVVFVEVHLGLKSFWQVPLTSCAAEVSAFASCVSYSIQLYRLDLKMLLYFQTVDVDACA